MDTLCIPLQRNHEDLYNTSLASMASIYAGAEMTLVIDAELRTITADEIECLAQIICSVWMRRSWTLQEGLLSRKCAFWFADNTLTFRPTEKGDFMHWKIEIRPLDDTTPHGRRDLGHPIQNSLRKYLEDYFCRTRQLVLLKDRQYWHFENTKAKRLAKRRNSRFQVTVEPAVTKEQFEIAFANCFVLVWNTLMGRSTTKPEDVFLILANMLDVSCGPLLDMVSNFVVQNETSRNLVLELPPKGNTYNQVYGD